MISEEDPLYRAGQSRQGMRRDLERWEEAGQQCAGTGGRGGEWCGGGFVWTSDPGNDSGYSQPSGCGQDEGDARGFGRATPNQAVVVVVVCRVVMLSGRSVGSADWSTKRYVVRCVASPRTSVKTRAETV